MILGLDLSIANTGYCVLDSKGEFVESGTITTQAKNRHVVRWHAIHQAITTVLKTYAIQKVVLEGLGFNSFRVVPSAELSGIIRYYLYTQRMPFKVVPPTTLKKLATGHGKASKDKMLRHARRMHRLEFKNDHECDAFWLARMEYEGKIKARGIYDFVI